MELNLEMEAYGRQGHNARWFKPFSADGNYVYGLPESMFYSEASSERIRTETNAANSTVSYMSIRSKLKIERNSEFKRGDYCAGYAQHIANTYGISKLDFVVCSEVVDDVTDFGCVRNIIIHGLNAREQLNTWYNDTYTLFKGQIPVSSNFRDMIEIVAVGWPTPYMRLYKLSADGDEIQVKPDFLYEYFSDRVLKLAVNENTAGHYRVDVGYLAPVESKRFQVKLIEMPEFDKPMCCNMTMLRSKMEHIMELMHVS
ncbi:uncharacterized protein LOC141900730 [Tubulanus polymorphus]|uniref:uncharacterized protein LOC141900730 n=1 Tax=Tubulanus polymorphus TaxID=672921 RepID=UPI003DA51021